MGFFDRFKKALSAPASEEGVLWLYVRCDRCGEKIRVRIDRRYDVNPDYEKGGYILRKEILGYRCPQLIYATLHFDRNFNVTSRDITGGQFITREEFEAQEKG